MIRLRRILPPVLLTLAAAAQDSSVQAQVQEQRGEESPASSVWAARCTSQGRRDALDCSVEQTVILTKTGQQLLSITVRVPPDTRQPALMIQLPLGLFLPAGVTLQLDGQKPEQLEVQTCDQKGCYVGSAISAKMLDVMKQGEKMTIAFQDLPKNKISVPVPLKGFAAAYQKVQ